MFYIHCYDGHNNVVYNILSLDDEEQELIDETSKVKKLLLQVDLKFEQLLLDAESSPKINKIDTITIRLPKVRVPSFDGNILNRTSYREQSEVAVHNKCGLQEVEKLAYLKDVVKDSPARHVIEGLLQTTGRYSEAIGCLQEQHDTSN